ncbi:hypothetical protein HY498_01600 [Candidatus Woesearchaeota archaeon]|nr:hypothetical protein [Candidatus Woesearchaeota archaeon]
MTKNVFHRNPIKTRVVYSKAPKITPAKFSKGIFEPTEQELIKSCYNFANIIPQKSEAPINFIQKPEKYQAELTGQKKSFLPERYKPYQLEETKVSKPAYLPPKEKPLKEFWQYFKGELGKEIKEEQKKPKGGLRTLIRGIGKTVDGTIKFLSTPFYAIGYTAGGLADGVNNMFEYGGHALGQAGYAVGELPKIVTGGAHKGARYVRIKVTPEEEPLEQRIRYEGVFIFLAFLLFILSPSTTGSVIGPSAAILNPFTILGSIFLVIGFLLFHLKNKS